MANWDYNEYPENPEFQSVSTDELNGAPVRHVNDERSVQDYIDNSSDVTVLGPGVHTFDSQILVSGTVVGIGDATLKPTFDGDPIRLLAGSTLEGVTVDGDRANRTVTNGLIVVNDSDNATLKDATIKKSPGWSLWCYNNENIRVIDTEFKNSHRYIRLDLNGGDFTMYGSRMTDDGTLNSEKNFIETVDAGSIEVQGTYFDGIARTTNTAATSGTYGNAIYLTDCNEVNISGVRTGPNNYWSGVVVGSGVTEINVSGSIFQRGTAGDRAVWVEQSGSETVEFAGNLVLGGVSVGDSGGEKVNVQGNTIIGPDKALNIWTGANHIVVSGNTVIRSGADLTDSATWSGLGIYCFNVDNVNLTGNYVAGYSEGIEINRSDGTGTSTGYLIDGNHTLKTTNGMVLGGSVSLDQSQIGTNLQPSNATTYDIL